MANHFIGGEDLDFAPLGAPAVSGTGSLFRAGYARGSLRVNLSQGWRVPASYGISVTTAAWLTARFYNQTSGGSFPLLRFNGDTDAPIIALYNDGTLWNVSGTPAQIATPTAPVPVNAISKLNVYYDFDTTGQINVYIDETLVVSFTGNTTGGRAALPGLDLMGGTCYWSEVLWADYDTRGIIGVVTLVPTADGATNNWTVDAVTNVNELVLDDATSDQSGTAGQVDLYTVGALPAGNYGILAVEVVSRSATTAGAPQNLKNLVRVGGTNYPSSTYAIGAAFERNAYVWTQNPNTLAAWLPSDLGAGFNVGMESVA